MKKENTQHPKSHPSAKPFPEYTDEKRMNDLIKIIPWITHADKHATIGQIADRLKMKHFIIATTDEINQAIDTITSDHEKSFVVMDQVKKGHAQHMDRFMLLDTGHRKIKSCRLVVNAGNGGKYAVEFWLPNGGIFKCWIGINMAEKYVVLGVDLVLYEKRYFQDLQNRGELQSATISWLLSEFPDGDGMKMAAQLINDFELTMSFPTPARLHTFNGFQAGAKLIGNDRVFGGTITANSDQDQNAGLSGTLFHPWNQIESITIQIQY